MLSSARPLPLVATLVAFMGAPTLSYAGSFEVFGVHPEGLAEASVRTAGAQDGSASFYNPGGLALGEGYQFELSGQIASSQLDVQGKRSELEDPVGLTFTLASDVPLEGPLANRLRVGLAMHSLPDRLMHLRTRGQSTPFFPYYDNRTQRLQAIPALSVKLAQGLGIGVGLNVLAGVEGPVDVREGQSRALETRIIQEAGTIARALVGIRFDPHERVHLGATFRQSFGVPLTVVTEADVAGVPLTVDVHTAEALYDPATVVVGGRFEPTTRWSFALDAAYHRWSAWEGPLLHVDTTVSALSLQTKPPEDLFQDTWTVRAAAAWTLHHSCSSEVRLHLGAGYESSMLDDTKQQGRSNFVDGWKVIGGTGLSARFPGLVGQALRIGFGVQVHQVATYEQDKIVCEQVPCPSGTVVGPHTTSPSEGIDNPGYPTLSGGGTVVAGALGVGVEL